MPAAMCAASKAAAALYTGSSAMMAEAVHSSADCANQLLLLLGLKQAKKEPTAQHPMGFGKATYFWSFVVALMLFSLGGAFSIYEGVHKFAHPEPVENPLVAIIVLAVGFALEAWSLKGCIAEIREKAGPMPLWRYFKESREAELVVIMGEDIAALLGLAFALLAISLAAIPGNPLFDAAGSIAVGVLLVIVAVGVGFQVQSLLIGESAAPETVAAMRTWIAGRDEIAELYDLMSLQMGSYIFVAVKARMSEGQDAGRLVDDVNRVQDGLKATFPEIRWVFFEPDDKRES